MFFVFWPVCYTCKFDVCIIIVSSIDGVSEAGGSVGGEEEVPLGAQTERENRWSRWSHHNHCRRWVGGGTFEVYRILLGRHQCVVLHLTAG